MTKLTALLFLCGLPGWLRGETVYFLDSARPPLQGEVTSFGDSGITLRVAITLSESLQGASTETISWSAIAHIDFPILDQEPEALADPGKVSLETLRELWMEKLPHLSRSKSNAGEIGLLYAERLLAEPSEVALRRAMDVFLTVERSDWNKAHLPRAKRGRLRALIASGQVEEATREAQVMASQSEEPEILLEAKYVLATAAFTRLRDLQKEHPRWMEDDDVLPKRAALLHDALDLFLHAYLFFGSEENASAQGLLGAAQVHQFAGDVSNARACAQDILRLYPQTAARPEAERLLNSLSSTESVSTNQTNAPR